MMMINKVKKYLLRHSEINFYRKNSSGSEYYKVGNSIIRVSDHVTTSNNYPDTLNIVVSGDNFIVLFGNKIINVNNYEDFKKFLKYHIQMCDCFKDIINKGLGRKETPVKKIVKSDGVVQAPLSNHTVETFKIHPNDPRLEGLRETQIAHLTNQGFKSYQTLINSLNNCRRMDGLPEVQ